VGALYIDEKPRECYVLEDQFQSTKVAGETRIPAGHYSIGFRTEGRLHNKYAKKFPDFHKGMLEIQDIHDFTYVMFHIGNDDDDTEGCPLVGQSLILDTKLRLVRSTVAYEKFYKQVANELTNLRSVELFIEDLDVRI
jgi:hypothetical protein